MGLNDSIVTYKAILNDFMQSFVYINIKLSTFEIDNQIYIVLNDLMILLNTYLFQTLPLI